MQLISIQNPVEIDLEAVNALLLECTSSKVGLINEIEHYVLKSGGKQLRPLILLLMARASGAKGKAPIHLAAIIELIHTATLLHDDVVDNSMLRRSQKTANALWGNEAAVLAGDFLYSKAFQQLIELDHPDITKRLISTTHTIAEGEALQLLARDNLDIEESDYFQMIDYKTAELFEIAAYIGASLGQADANRLSQFGKHFGRAFQLIDDLLDYCGTETGKPQGNDFLEGNITLPIIYALKNTTPTENTRLREMLTTKNLSALPDIAHLLKKTGAIDHVNHYATQEMQQAQQALNTLPDSAYRQAAFELIEFSLTRTY